MCYHDPYHCCHILQPSAMPGTFGKSLNISFIFVKTYPLQGLLPMVISWICTCQICMQMLLGMMTSYLASGCDIQNLHLQEKDILHCLALRKYHWVWVPHGLGLISTWFSLTASRHSLTFQFVSALKLSCCKILQSNSCLVVLWCLAVCLTLTLLWQVFGTCTTFLRGTCYDLLSIKAPYSIK